MDSRSGAGMTEGKGRITPTLTLPHQGGENLLLPPLWGKVGMGGLDCGFRHNDAGGAPPSPPVISSEAEKSRTLAGRG